MGYVRTASGKKVKYSGNRDDWTQGWWEDTNFGEQVMTAGLIRLRMLAQMGKTKAIEGMYANSNPNPNPPPRNLRSSEDEYPAVQSSNLEMHMGVSGVAVEPNKLMIAYGVNVSGADLNREKQHEEGYAYYLEVGTDKMEPRPYLKLSLEELQDEGF